MLSRLEAVAAGKIKRLMVLMPPGAAKSTYVSVLFPAWLMARFPGTAVLAASHTIGLAENFSRKVQREIRDNAGLLGVGLANEASERWSATNGSEYRAAGVGSAIAGFRADWGIIDDPVKGRKEADSETYRNAAWDWYNADFLTRLKPDASVGLIVTRWHEDDLAGRILERHGDAWDVLSLPAQAGENDPLGRAPGEWLWADDDYGYAKTLPSLRETLGARDWASLYQQSPRPDDGGVFKPHLMPVIDAAPAGAMWVRAWDLAATKESGTSDPSRTVGALLGKTQDGRLIVRDVVRFAGTPDEVEATILATASRDGRTVYISCPQDPGQAGKSQAAYLSKKMVGYRFVFTPETGDKATRAMPFASQVNVGNVSMVKAPWNDELVAELQTFPSGVHDDQVDALSRGFDFLTQGAAVLDRFRAMAS